MLTSDCLLQVSPSALEVTERVLESLRLQAECVQVSCKRGLRLHRF
jgi:hypothetical protein